MGNFLEIDTKCHIKLKKARHTVLASFFLLFCYFSQVEEADLSEDPLAKVIAKRETAIDVYHVW